MSYIGNQVTSVPYITDVYTGDGSTNSFGPLTRAPAGIASIAVFINGSYKTPGFDYTLNGNYINFFSAPPLGAGVVIHHLGNGTTTQVPSDGSVTGTKLAINSVRGNNIVEGTITSNTLSSNLAISVSRTIESSNINSIGIGGNVNIDVSNNTVFYFNANTTANITFNLRANNQSTFDSILSTGQSLTIIITVKNGTIRHTANLYIDGGLIQSGPSVFDGGSTANAIFYAEKIIPNYQLLTNAELNTFVYNISKMSANSYHVTASNTLFGLS